jgi:D-3-phosphoglycerate dehydrogenase / 2-oxoglutarate reductase
MASEGRQRVLGSGPVDDPFFGPTRVELAKANIDLVLKPIANTADLIEAARDVDVIYEGSVQVTGDVMRQLPRLRALCARGIGVDRFDVDAATEHGIVVINLPRVFHREVAHHAISLLLASIRQIVPLNNAMKARAENPDTPLRPAVPHQHIYGQTLGIVSLGNIGRVVATLLRPFELNIIAYDPFVPQSVADEYGVRMVETLDDLCQQADFISVHAPLSAATRHLITEKHFRQMKRSAIFVNTGRGPVVDEEALIKALREGWIAAAGLDVQEKEPPDPDNPLLRMDNVILTPHVASASDLARVERARWMGIEVSRVLAGKYPIHGHVNKNVVPRFPLSRD